MKSVELDVGDPESIAKVAKDLIAKYSELNVLINNADMMKMDDVSAEIDDGVLVSTLATNLMGPIRMTSALIDHLKQKEAATVVTVTSGLAFTPMAPTSIYCSTKAAIHSYTMSLRFRLRGTKVRWWS